MMNCILKFLRKSESDEVRGYQIEPDLVSSPSLSVLSLTSLDHYSISVENAVKTEITRFSS